MMPTGPIDHCSAYVESRACSLLGGSIQEKDNFFPVQQLSITAPHTFQQQSSNCRLPGGSGNSWGTLRALPCHMAHPISFSMNLIYTKSGLNQFIDAN